MKPREFDRWVGRFLDDLPAVFAGRIDNLSVQVEEFPSREILLEVGADDPLGLLGFYTGTPLYERTHDHVDLPDVILLFRRPILAEAEEAGLPVERVILETLLHELAHHFGFSEADLDPIEAEWAVRAGAAPPA